MPNPIDEKREELHEVLVEILGSRNVYFQPPESIKLKYPCIIYELAYVMKLNANNTMYAKHKRYTVTLIDLNPDSEIPDKIIQLNYCRFDRFYTADNLNHWVYELYY